jgi:hypothetical protein
MHEFVRPVAAALSVVCLAAAIAIAFAGDALAQANQAPPNPRGSITRQLEPAACIQNERKDLCLAKENTAAFAACRSATHR